MKKPFCLLLLVTATSVLSLGTVVQRKDAIRRTQTDPASYQEKAKEEAEGKKGPPAPALNLFPKERFLYEAPVGKAKESVAEPPREEEIEFWLDEDEEKNPEGQQETVEGEEFKLEEGTDDIWEGPDAEPNRGQSPLVTSKGSKSAARGWVS